MATIVGTRGRITGEHRFFLTMALVMAAIIIAGFSHNLIAGRSSFSLPLIFHVHAFVFFGWVALYVTQNALVATGSVQLHRRLGWLAVAWLPVMVGLGLALTVRSLQTHGGPPFFDMNEFMIGNPFGLIYFAGMVVAAIVMRRRTAWHRRLMYCGMASLTGPAFGRLMPMPLLIPWGWWIVSFALPLIFPLIGAAADFRRSGRAHPAWLWGMGTMLATIVATDLIAYSPAGYVLTRAVVAGTPGAERGFAAHMP